MSKIQGLFKEFKSLSNSFQGLKVILVLKFYFRNARLIMETLVQENQHKIVVPIFGAA